jgi:hypothetical protein
MEWRVVMEKEKNMTEENQLHLIILIKLPESRLLMKLCDQRHIHAIILPTRLPLQQHQVPMVTVLD